MLHYETNDDSLLFPAYYQGYIKNKDTIMNWRMVPPYPNVSLRGDNDSLKWNKKPKLQYFIKNESVRRLEKLPKE